MSRKLEDLTGQRFGRLTVLEYENNNKWGQSVWICRCDCGNKIVTRGYDLKNGKTQSCGCFNKDRVRETLTSHGLTKHPLYKTWASMRSRCNDEHTKHYNRYGGRGISICEEWNDFQNFYDWSMINEWRPDLTIDRIDNDGDYCPENCRWTDRVTQCNNTSRNHYFTFSNETHTISEWSRILGVHKATLRDRINQDKLFDFERYFQDTKE